MKQLCFSIITLFCAAHTCAMHQNPIALLLRLSLHTSQVNSLAFSPDGSKIASASDDGIVWIVEVASGRRLQKIRHTSSVKSAFFSPDSRQIVSTPFDNTVRVWDLPTKTCSYVLTGHTMPVIYAMFSPDGRQIASASLDGTLRVWDLTLKTYVQTHVELKPYGTPTSFSPNGKIASASGDKTVQISDIMSNRCIHTLKGLDRVTCVSFSPDGTKIAFACAKGTIQVHHDKRVQAYKNATAILAGQHHRCGKNSPIRLLDKHLLQCIIGPRPDPFAQVGHENEKRTQYAEICNK